MKHYDIKISFTNPEDLTPEMELALNHHGYETYGASGHLLNPHGDQPGAVCYMRKDKKSVPAIENGLQLYDMNQHYNQDRGEVVKINLPDDADKFLDLLYNLSK